MSKPWERPWSTDEIIDSSDSWSLAGDVALLHTLQAFSETLLGRTRDIDNKLQNLTNSLDQTSLQLDIAQNEFQGLRNTQFIESRVYEDDESLPVTEEKKVEEKTEDHSEDVRLAAVKGLQVLEQYFEKVDVSVSDSEDEDIDLPNYVLRPRDLYIHRPLPYVIGSSEWHKTWHVGLEDSSSDSETEKVSDKFSESDSESEHPIIQDRSQIKGTSDTSSEFDFSQKHEAKLNIPNSSGSDNSVPISQPNFAEQLAAKLGHVVTEYQEPEVNTRPIVKPAAQSHYGDMFFDEPPPLDEPKGIFSGGGGLFDDDDIPSPRTGKTGGLFDGDSDEEKEVPPPKKTVFPVEPPQIQVKKPVGGVSILGGGNLFDKKLLRRQPSSDEDDEPPKETKKVDLFGDDDLFSGQKKNEGQVKQKINLFDSEEEDGLFSEEKKTEPPPKTSLFDDTAKDPKPKKVSLFDDTATITKEDPKPQKVSLFDDDDDLFKDDLFSSNTKKSFTSGLFDDISGEDLFKESQPSGNLFDDLVPIPDNDSINVDPPPPETNKSSSASPRKSEPPPKPQPRLSLFDSPPPEPDDLFASKNSDEASDLFVGTPPKSSTPQTTPSLSLFDPNPPPDDEWETKSDVSDDDGGGNDLEVTGGKTSLFSEEPPALPPETMKPKPGKLKHNLNINVGALRPGYVPPKRTEVPDAPPSPPVVATAPTASFDETDKVEVLHSVTKDRARVPLNRRPSTRRGRQAALKNTIPDFKLKDEEEELPREKSEENLFAPTHTNRIEPESDLFGPPEDIFTASGAKSDLFGASDDLFAAGSPPESDLFGDSQTINPPKVEDLFAEEVPKSDDLFAAEVKNFTAKKEEEFGDSPAINPPKDADLFAEKLPKEEDSPAMNPPKDADLFASKSDAKKAEPKSLFDDDDDDDDLFTVKKPPQLAKTKKSLFDDDNEEDDDIFKDFSSAGAKKTEIKVATEKRIPKVSSVKKLENTKPDDDPLSALLK